jgi:hypothetical protein
VSNGLEQAKSRDLDRYGSGEHLYENVYPLSKRTIVVSFPEIQGAGDLPKLIKHIVKNLPKKIDYDELTLMLELYAKAAAANSWNYSTRYRNIWEEENSALLSVDNTGQSTTQNFLCYGLKRELYAFTYEDTLFGKREYIGRVEEISRDKAYLILDSNGAKRRLNFSKIVKLDDYGPKWGKRSGTMGYVQFTFEELSETARKVTWRKLPDDRSITLRAALGLPLEAVSKPPVKEVAKAVAEDPVEKYSPLTKWSQFLEKPVSVTVSENGKLKNYFFVLDHLAWTPEDNLVEIGSKSIKIASPPEEITLEALPFSLSVE